MKVPAKWYIIDDSEGADSVGSLPQSSFSVGLLVKSQTTIESSELISSH